MLSLFLVIPSNIAYPLLLPLLLKPPTPASRSWHSPILGHITFTGPKASPPIDGQLGHPQLHIQLEPWVPPCVFFVGGLVPGTSGVLVSSYCCSSYGTTKSFISLGTFSSSFIGDPVLSPMVDCDDPPLYLSLVEPLRRQWYQAPVSKLLLASTIVSGFVGCL